MSGTTTTPNYSLLKPIPGADNDQWGTHLNTNADILDAQLKATDNKASAAAVPPSTTTPIMDGTAAIGTGTTYARADHIHPSDTSRVAKAGDTMTGGLSFGSALASSPVDTSRHIALYSTNFGFGITSARLNYNVQGGAFHAFRSGNFDRVLIGDTGLAMQAATDITLARDPSSALQAVTKQYADSPAANPLPYNRSGATWTLGTAFTNIGADQAFDLNTISGVGAGPYTSYIGWHRIFNQTAGLNFPPGVVGGGVWTSYTANPGWNVQLLMGTGLWYRWVTGGGNYNAWSQVVLASGATMTGALALAGVSTAPTAAVGNNTTQIATTAFVQTAVAPALGNVGRNLLHNGLFNVAQRGVGPFTASGALTADRWYLTQANDAQSVSVIALADADRAAIGDEAAISALQTVFTGSATAGSFSAIGQRTESVRRLGGKTVTLSFWAKASSGSPRLAAVCFQVFGTGGSPSASVQTLLGTTPALTAAWTRYSLTVAVPSTTGKTLGTTGGTDYTQLAIWASDTSNQAGAGIGQQSGTVQFFGMQLEIGSTATPLEKPDPQQDLAKCQRFYCTGNFYNTGYSPVNAASFAQSISFPVTMRAFPTCVPSYTTQTNCGGSSLTVLGSGSVIATTINAGVGVNFIFQGTFTASADL